MEGRLYHKPKVGQSAYFCFVAYLLLLYSCPNIELGKAQSAYHTPYGSKNHLLTCWMIENTSIRIEEALEQGLEPCIFCDPPVLSQPDDNLPVQLAFLGQLTRKSRHNVWE